VYSLGVVFFELWQPFKTGMERIHVGSSLLSMRAPLTLFVIQVLRDLRKSDIVFPPAWNENRLSRQAKIVRSCLVHDPELRFSPKELLDSDLLPPRVGDDSIVETIRLLCKIHFCFPASLRTNTN
jgi:translation initiation factor 2-alpha kinase 4